ncbi:MAG: response regulator transcription factor [Cyclobacteriaceae bacterium]|nr:response regulator transcription factor [Cyclobacteriaceae bacterium]
MIRCLIVDDEPYARKLLEEFIQKLPELTLVGTPADALSARSILSKQKVDVLFLDIQMPDLTGIDFLKSTAHRPLVIFTTAFAEYALEGFELDAVDYLLKPFDFNRFLKAVNKITERLPAGINRIEKDSAPERDFLFVKDGYKLVKIDLKSVLYIKGSREYVTFMSENSKVMSLLSLKDLEDELPSDFVRIHHSFIVRIDAIQSISKEEVTIGDESLPIGATYKKGFFQKIERPN